MSEFQALSIVRAVAELGEDRLALQEHVRRLEGVNVQLQQELERMRGDNAQLQKAIEGLRTQPVESARKAPAKGSRHS